MKALMLAVFGTSTEASVAFDQLSPRLKEHFAYRDIFIPYTSGIIRDKLNKTAKIKILSPDETLHKLKKSGYTDIIVVTTLLFEGVEYDKLKASVDKFAIENESIHIKLINPLLNNATNIEAAVKTLAPYIIDDGINIIVSHGTKAGHPSEACYKLVDTTVRAMYKNSVVMSIEGFPYLESVMDEVRKMPEKKVRFIVFMFVAGEHAENDIAGDLFDGIEAMGKQPELLYVDIAAKPAGLTLGKRILSLGLDKAYQDLLINHIIKSVEI